MKAFYEAEFYRLKARSLRGKYLRAIKAKEAKDAQRMGLIPKPKPKDQEDNGHDEEGDENTDLSELIKNFDPDQMAEDLADMIIDEFPPAKLYGREKIVAKIKGAAPGIIEKMWAKMNIHPGAEGVQGAAEVAKQGGADDLYKMLIDGKIPGHNVPPWQGRQEGSRSRSRRQRRAVGISRATSRIALSERERRRTRKLSSSRKDTSIPL